MLARSVLLSLFAGILVWFQAAADGNPSYWFFVIPILFLFFFYWILLDEWVSFWSACFLFAVSVVFGTIQKQGISYLLLPILGFFISVGALLIVRAYLNFWHRQIISVEDRKLSVDREAGVLRDRFRERGESLKHLEKQVTGLIHLFEMARYFNDCLSFQELIVVLDQKISPQLSFSQGTVVLVDPLDQSSKRINQALSFGPSKREQSDTIQYFAQTSLNLLTSLNHPTKIESEKECKDTSLQTFDVKFPLWLFPLAVEHQLIGILMVEGGNKNDYPRFEILASQLALQVRKIRLYETVKQISIVDGLTEVFVRRHFLERFREELDRAIRHRFPLSVLMVDVDHFKRYNDEFGHLVGDRALREVAQVIRDNVRKVDVLGRYGGEEFIVVAPEIPKKQGIELAERIRSAVAKRVLKFYGEETKVTVSIGISAFPNDLSDKEPIEFREEYIQDLIQRADQALYRAKEEGRNRVVNYS